MTSKYYNIKKNKGQAVKKKDLKVAIVHDFLLYPGGAEKILSGIVDIFPNAPIYTLLYDSEKMKGMFAKKDIKTSFLQKWPKFLRDRHRYLLPFFGTAVESFDFREFDLIISSSGAWSKGIVTRLNTTHIAYIHSPMRYVWDENEHYFRKSVGKKNNFCIRTLLSYLRVWDNQAAQRPDLLIANSVYTQRRIEKYYRRESQIVYPFGLSKKDIKNKGQNREGEYFLIISRLSEYKNVALAIETCNKLQLKLIIIGQGREYKSLNKLAGDTIKFVGWVEEQQKINYLMNARALLFPVEDDFGIVCIEAMNVGIPVIALDKGGAHEIVQSGITGELFKEPTVEMMADALRRFLEVEDKYDIDKIKKMSDKYTKKQFNKKINSIINKKIIDK
jgi:glycosyltransferase involved in cell wall biosynthesis